MEQLPTMAYEPQQIANWILSRFDLESGDAITHLKLQKLIYYVQAWVLADHGISLFEEDFEAWAHGPVLKSIYSKYKDKGFDAILDIEEVPEINNTEILATMEDVIDVYGEHTAKYLEKLTHSELPWQKARGNISPEERSNNIIKKEWIKEYYSNLNNE